ncbi:hypothetical protein CCACVL1_08463, partial [Corchorus capsularis]
MYYLDEAHARPMIGWVIDGLGFFERPSNDE